MIFNMKKFLTRRKFAILLNGGYLIAHLALGVMIFLMLLSSPFGINPEVQRSTVAIGFEQIVFGLIALVVWPLALAMMSLGVIGLLNYGFFLIGLLLAWFGKYRLSLATVMTSILLSLVPFMQQWSNSLEQLQSQPLRAYAPLAYVEQEARSTPPQFPTTVNFIGNGEMPVEPLWAGYVLNLGILTISFWGLLWVVSRLWKKLVAGVRFERTTFRL